MSNDEPSADKQLKRQHADYWPWIILLLIILITAAIRIRLLEIPLERDEGEYAYAGQLILQGIAPYDQLYNMKMPGIYGAYAAIMAVFGQTHSGIHLGLLFINSATIVLMFLLAKKLAGPVAASAAAVAFALLSLGQFVDGLSANAEHFVILPAIGGILLLIRAVERQKYTSLFAGAVLLGLAFMMKQHGAVFIIFGGIYLFFCELRRRPFERKSFLLRSTVFIAGILLPFVLTCLVLFYAGVFEKFWFWTFEYARQYVSAVPFSIGLSILKSQITRIAASAVLIWILAGIGLTGLFWNKKNRQHSLFIAGFLFFSFLSTCPGLYFRSHYFLFLLPAVALLAGVGFRYIYDLSRRAKSVLIAVAVPVLLALTVMFHTLYQQREFFFVMDPVVASRARYGGNPFGESLQIARFIQDRSSADDRIAILGSEPQIFFYANRRSATGYIYMYPLMEDHPYALQMQTEMISQIEAVKPKFIVFVNIPTSWLAKRDSHKLIFQWFSKFAKNYSLVGIIDIIPHQPTIYKWDDETSKYPKNAKPDIFVWQTKNNM